MQFLYNKNAGKPHLNLENEEILHLKARRIRQNDCLKLRNLEDDFLYEYELIKKDKKSCKLILLSQSFCPTPQSSVNLALAVIDVKILEKIVPFLNELGLLKLILVWSEYSQRNFQPDFSRLNKILICSCQQCGRAKKMELESFFNVKDFLERYPKAILVDFKADSGQFDKDALYFIGPEGGFSEKERQMFHKKFALKTSNILKSHSAALAVAAKILL
ncbi:16S rRNA (uracil(1498)-N(3))-methyltransferase [Campylobacter sp. MIT 21-1685]|uniref:16S rRNA (uracil(1498)-N(3))-methyltransferase n=1 Tax=unclassified Campylobacter TaxID=2593542 RepID=UPI00224B83F6|nr:MULTISPECIES: 16S rRNA (uracil(1498)-N(3))-methyltransferase [unclassified Campylobacter]MCX2682723.1 16S rRNA (uracil(1498)-N(3))-methyltransferase [Campylobacter sp. MIT 21-1684]MCX2751005.1 16S rRNA (uracil(1498)-N(3))-methyltransferase [Campylobacter sp. MIT 21-1682]MCX2807064.1 16S rRNA (uracil(1498)-N(3))-methyltransferase [Campylobacter sp. MIT 21-1685]